MTEALEAVGILLAAGRGTRFSPDGTRNKLLADAGGQPVCVAAAASMLAALPEVAAATSPRTPEVAQALRAAGCAVLVCERSEGGMGCTLAQAVGALKAARLAARRPLPAWCVMPADMPRVAPATIAALLAAWRGLAPAGRGLAAIAPAHDGARGHPVLLGPDWTDALCGLDGDAGARALIAPHLRLVAVDDPGCLYDVDTPEALAGLPPAAR
ncbi:nucleotidyltransferase family protein [Pigmentiphaga soli]|uniref:Nucleotidyltransferase family protein n=1 Tax=Pigmentiphaga soli TaxID=1007095 RepID=A0ABP8HRQ3_9BURK